MTRTASSALLATIQLSFVFLGVPIWFVIRITGTLLPLRALDLALVGALVCWSYLVKAILDRHDSIDSLLVATTSPAGYAHRVVDASLLGASFETIENTTETRSLYLVEQPRVLVEHDLPVAGPASEFAQGWVELEEAGPQSVSILHSEESTPLSVLETQEYIVARGDTFWSIAESVLADGRKWPQLQQLNLDREVSPGVLLTSNHELHIGWSILLPVTTPTNADQNEADYVAH